MKSFFAILFLLFNTSFFFTKSNVEIDSETNLKFSVVPSQHVPVGSLVALKLRFIFKLFLTSIPFTVKVATCKMFYHHELCWKGLVAKGTGTDNIGFTMHRFMVPPQIV